MTDSPDRIINAYWTHYGRVWAMQDEASAVAPSAAGNDAQGTPGSSTPSCATMCA